MHFRSANEDGLKLGRLIGGKVFDRFQPAKGSSQGTVSTEKGTAAAAAHGRKLRA